MIYLSLGPDAICSDALIGRLLDDRAPYRGFGLTEFKILQTFLQWSWEDDLDTIPAHTPDQAYWQYGAGNHSIPARKILGSVMTILRFDNVHCENLCDHIISGTSQWVIGCDATRAVKFTTSTVKGWFCLRLKVTAQTIPSRSRATIFTVSSHTKIFSQRLPSLYWSAKETVLLHCADSQWLFWTALQIDPAPCHISAQTCLWEFALTSRRLSSAKTCRAQRSINTSLISLKIVLDVQLLLNQGHPKGPFQLNVSSINNAVCVDHINLRVHPVFTPWFRSLGTTRALLSNLQRHLRLLLHTNCNVFRHSAIPEQFCLIFPSIKTSAQTTSRCATLIGDWLLSNDTTRIYLS